MSRRLPIVVVLIALVLAPWSASEARAQEPAAAVPLDLGPAIVMSFAEPIRLPDLDQIPFQARRPQPKAGGRSLALGSLYASTAVLQGLDIHSTLSVLNRGGGEGNPLMAGVVKNKAAFIGVKAAVATSTILATRQLAKRNKVAAVVALVAINSTYALIVRHNYKVAQSLK